MVEASEIAGGILLFYVGFEMLQSKKSNIHNSKEEEKDFSLSLNEGDSSNTCDSDFPVFN